MFYWHKNLEIDLGCFIMEFIRMWYYQFVFLSSSELEESEEIASTSAIILLKSSISGGRTGSGGLLSIWNNTKSTRRKEDKQIFWFQNLEKLLRLC